MKIKSYYLTMSSLLLILGIVVILSCSQSSVRPTPQTDVNYRQADYHGQVPRQTIDELKEKYPSGYWQSESKPVAPHDRLRVAITQFNSPKPLENVARLATEIFSFAITQSVDFDVYERDQLDKVTKELELNQSGLVRSDTAVKIGQFPGVDLIITGSVSNPQRLDVKVLELKTAKAELAFQMNKTIDNNNTAFFARSVLFSMQKQYYHGD